MPCVAALRSSGITICDSASNAPIEIISTDTASRASAMPLLISRKSSSIAAGQVRTTHRNPRCEVDVSIGCAMVRNRNGVSNPRSRTTRIASTPLIPSMAFSSAVQRYRLDTFDLDRFVDYEDESIAASGIG